MERDERGMGREWEGGERDWVTEVEREGGTEGKREIDGERGAREVEKGMRIWRDGERLGLRGYH